MARVPKIAHHSQDQVREEREPDDCKDQIYNQSKFDRSEKIKKQFILGVCENGWG